MEGTKQEEVLLQDGLDIEKGFNDAIDDLRKSLDQDEDGNEESSAEELNKAKAPPFKKKNDDEEPEEDEDEEDEEDVKKSVEETLMEDPEAAAAMDVEPFLLQLAKAIDEGQAQSDMAINAKLKKIESLVKSIGAAALASAELQKSTREIVKQIGDTPLPTGSVRRIQKARFDNADGNPQEFDTRLVLEKSRDWIKTGKIDLMEAGRIEGRINKGLLGRTNDRLDQKVAALMKEE
ncbi:MAG: hypothetical protein ACXADB_00550 [Candidatus Hermodarchaeia archaeon]|jgi:hypothetical protein